MSGQVRSVCVLSVVMGTLLGVADQAVAVVVTFPDAVLEAKVRSVLGVPVPTPVTDTDMQRMHWLLAFSSGITDIHGLEYATNLTKLWLDENRISDISAISGLTNLSDLLLDHNRISDISALSRLTNLNQLWLSVNQISDISAVAGLTNLTELSLYANQIHDISPITDLSNLSYLLLSENQISDISAVAGLTKLFGLELFRNQVSDISAVAGLTNLIGLNLCDNQVRDVSAVAGLTNLTNLNLSSNQISDISSIAGLTKLNMLTLSSNQVSDISIVSGLTKLISLDLRWNQVSDISALAGLTDLDTLYLEHNHIEIMDLSSSCLPSLRYLGLEDNPVTDVLLADAIISQSTFNVLMDGGHASCTGIAELSGVSTLDMSGVDFSGIADLSRMYTIDDLETLLLAGATNLDGSKVVSLTDELDSLNWLDVTGLWNNFDADTRSFLGVWDAIEGNTLVVPEPSVLVLLLAAFLSFVSRRRRG